jgi:ribosomal-protein-alanine N-acetyltransferase
VDQVLRLAKRQDSGSTLVKAPAQIETARLVLLQPQAADAEAIFERYASDPEVTKFLGWPRHESVADTHAFLRFSAGSGSDGQLLGGTGFGFEGQQQAATGYVLAKDAWGKGCATEALGAVIDVARRIGVARLEALCHPRHRASWRVLEKCGFVQDRSWTKQAEFPNLAPGVQQDVLCYTTTFDLEAKDAG